MQSFNCVIEETCSIHINRWQTVQLVKTELSIIDSENQVNKNKKSIRSDKIGNILSVELAGFFPVYK